MLSTAGARPPVALVLMGVTGCGKTTIGRILSQRLGWPFLDGDDFHSSENVARMAAGMPLTDADRLPWLHLLAGELGRRLDGGDSCLLACSALRASYRRILRGERGDGIRFIHLQGSVELIGARLAARVHRYMPAALLQSQFDALESPDDAWTVDIEAAPEQIAAGIIEALDLRPTG